MKIECNVPVLCAGEHGTRTLTISVEEAFRQYEVRLLLKSPRGLGYTSGPVTLTAGQGSYTLPAGVLDGRGTLFAQVTAENGEGQIARSEVYAFPVAGSLPCGTESPGESGLVTAASLDSRLRALETAVGGMAVDDTLSGSSENPVQNKAVKAALDGKQAALQFDTVPTPGSENMLQSGKIYNALALKADAGAVPTVPVISTDIGADAASDSKTASPKAVKTYVDGATSATTATGTFTPAFTERLSGTLNIKQIGNVVYVTGALYIDGTWADLTGNNLGTISGVAAPAVLEMIPVMSMDNSNNMHAGYVALFNDSGTLKLLSAANTGDRDILINGYYLV